MRKQARRWKKPTARCMCARRNGGTKRDCKLSVASRIMTKPTPFALRIPDADIADLRDRLARTRFPDQAPGEAWAYGTDVDYLRELTEYWRDHFDWRAAEAALNAFPKFRVPLAGVDLTYLHVQG